MKPIIAAESIEGQIHLIRGHRVMLDRDLAALYGVETRVLIQSVKRNLSRFPADFLFQLTAREEAVLRSQIVISKTGPGGRRYLSYAFTEQGVAMLSGVLNSPRAVQVNIAIMRAFVKLRQALALHKELAAQLSALETRFSGHDENIREVFAAIRRLMEPSPEPPESSRPRIGFKPGG